MSRDPLAAVPPVRGFESGTATVPGLDATARDLRWHANLVRGTIAAGSLLLWLVVTRINLTHLDRDTWWMTDVPMLVVAAWWITGTAGAARRSVSMGAAMAAVVANGVATWRAMPEPDRSRARRVAAGLLASGQRHDVDAVRLRLVVLAKAAGVAQARRGWDDDVVELDGWIDGADETRRGPWYA